MKKWFCDVFLSSIFQRAGVNKYFWLSQKQTAICTENMEKHISTTFDGYTNRRHFYYTCEWRGRTVTLNYSMKNGCGSVIFGMDAAEQEQARISHENEKKRIEMERIQLIKKKPERLQKRIAQLKQQERIYIDSLSIDENTDEDIQFFTEKLNECRLLLEAYEA